jgi:hypothetical protein
MQAIKIKTGTDFKGTPLTRTYAQNDDGDSMICPHSYAGRQPVVCCDNCPHWHLANKCGISDKIRTNEIKLIDATHESSAEKTQPPAEKFRLPEDG